MASESIFGTASASVPLSAIPVLDRYMTDTITTSLLTQNIGNGATVVVASGGNNDINIAITPPTSATTGQLSEGAGKVLTFQLPANTGLVSKTADFSDPTQATNYVKSIVDRYIPDGTSNTAAAAQKAAVIAAVTKAMQLVGGGTNISVSIRNIDFFSGAGTQASVEASEVLAILDSDGAYAGIDSLVGSTNDVVLDAGVSSGSQLFVVNLSSISGRTLILENVEGAVLASSGNVKAQGSTPIRITSDGSAQVVTGGSGADTLVGTGNDTLTGGSGNDVFGFSGVGKYTITDFNKSGDLLAFNLAGISNLDQLKAAITGVSTVPGSITYQFGADTSITLVGISASDLTEAMLRFSIS